MGTEFEIVKSFYINSFSWICLDKEYVKTKSIDVETGVKQALIKLDNVIDSLINQVKELIQELRNECLKLHTLNDVYFIINYLLTKSFAYYRLSKLLWCKLRDIFKFEEITHVLSGILNRLKHILSNESLPLKICEIWLWKVSDSFLEVNIQVTEEYGESIYLRTGNGCSREELINYLAKTMSISKDYALVPIPTKYINFIEQHVFNKVQTSLIKSLMNW